jgi:hypothetical protein
MLWTSSSLTQQGFSPPSSAMKYAETAGHHYYEHFYHLSNRVEADLMRIIKIR